MLLSTRKFMTSSILLFKERTFQLAQMRSFMILPADSLTSFFGCSKIWKFLACSAQLDKLGRIYQLLSEYVSGYCLYVYYSSHRMVEMMALTFLGIQVCHDFQSIQHKPDVVICTQLCSDRIFGNCYIF